MIVNLHKCASKVTFSFEYEKVLCFPKSHFLRVGDEETPFVPMSRDDGGSGEIKEGEKISSSVAHWKGKQEIATLLGT